MRTALILGFILIICWTAKPSAEERILGSSGEVESVQIKKESLQNSCDFSELKELIVQQSKDFSQEIRQIKREIALTRQAIEKPGVKEIFAGIGYIFGLCGVALYFSKRKR